MKNKKFKKIVSCKLYQTRISYLAKRVSSPLPTQKKASTKNLNRIEKVEKDDEVEEGVEIDLDSNEDDE